MPVNPGNTDTAGGQGKADCRRRLVELLKLQRSGMTLRAIWREFDPAERPLMPALEAVLKELRRNGELEQVAGGRWRIAVATQETGRSIQMPEISKQHRRSQQTSATSLADRLARANDSRWSDFRRLCLYYAECIRLEGQVEVQAYSEDEGKKFTQLERVNWQRLEAGKSVAIKVGTQEASLVRWLSRQGDNAGLFLGAPVHVHAGKKRDTGERFRRLSPVFVIPVEYVIDGDALHLTPTAGWDVNHGWLQKRFKQADDRRSFLELCGLQIGASEEDADELNDAGAYDPRSITDLCESLKLFYKDWWQEPLLLHQLDLEPGFDKIRNTGFYNRAVLIGEKKLKYTFRLHGELLQLANPSKVDDRDLDQSALAHLFPHQRPTQKTDNAGRREAVLSQPAADEMLPPPAELEPLNEEQRQACERAATDPVTVVTGPPGTGKSRVVAHTLFNAALQRRSALFASRNHQALATVVPRLNVLSGDRPIVLQLAQKWGEDTPGNPLLHALTVMLDQPALSDVGAQLEKSTASLREHLQQRKELCRQLEIIDELRQQMRTALNELDHRLEWVPEQYHEAIHLGSGGPSVDTYESALKRARDASKQLPWYLRWIQPLRARRFRRQLQPEIEQVVRQLIDAVGDSRTAMLETPMHCVVELERWKHVVSALDSVRSVRDARRDLESNPPLNRLYPRFKSYCERIIDLGNDTLRLLATNQGVGTDGEDRQKLAEIRAELTNATGTTLQTQNKRIKKLLNQHLPRMLEHLPLWAETNLSAGKNLPMSPGAFDLLVVDEASQCDIASVVPLMFRARRVMVVGDPMQLPHVVNLQKEVDARLRERYGLDHEGSGFARFLHRQNFFSLAQSDAKVDSPVHLRKHHRSHPQIAEYTNHAFYAGTLAIRTDPARLRSLQRGEQKWLGVRWTDLPPDGEAAPGRGALSRSQIKAILDELKRLEEERYQGTVGVVTPFAVQATRIRDAAMEHFRSSPPAHWDFRVDTADGFQGGERDIILFSLVGGDDMPRGARWFLGRENRNRFNVAVSRARGVLNVFGPRDWCRSLPKDQFGHIVDLATAQDNEPHPASAGVRTDLIGPVWEPKFADALREADLPFQQQYHVFNRFYLDFAMLREGLKLAIEVDGEAHHRDPDGNLREADVKRDQDLIAAGWQVQRFWVYELRENMAKCIDKIRGIWTSGTHQ